MKYIDTHSHLYFPQYDDDREAVLARMREREVGTIVVGTSLETSTQAVALAKKEPDVVLGVTIGVHPTDTHEAFSASEYAPLLGERVVGVGECGFDYYRLPVRERLPERHRSQSGTQTGTLPPSHLHGPAARHSLPHFQTRASSRFCEQQSTRHLLHEDRRAVPSPPLPATP